MLALGFPIVIPLMILVALFEMAVDAEDQTSDHGVSVGPGEPDPENLKFGKRIEVTPLSNVRDGLNIYQDVPEQRARLPIRGFRGKWGGHSSWLDKSPSWSNNTGRYFRKFMRSENIRPDLVVDVD